MPDDVTEYLYGSDVKVRTGRPRSRKRVYLFECPVCKKWRSCPTITVQVECFRARCCVPCQAGPNWRINVYIRLLQLHIEEITKRAQTLPEEQRGVYRRLYKKRLRQAAVAKQQLETVMV